MLNGIQNFLTILNDNWTTLLVIIGLCVSIGKKTYDFVSKSTEEKVATAKTQIEEIMLKLVTEAEIEYESWVSAGSVKRSQVIAEIYEMFPILSKVADQEALIAWIDETINTALKTLRKIVSANATTEESAE